MMAMRTWGVEAIVSLFVFVAVNREKSFQCVNCQVQECSLEEEQYFEVVLERELSRQPGTWRGPKMAPLPIADRGADGMEARRKQVREVDPQKLSFWLPAWL
jgi:hypothetical protein